jgi:YidC/Oxa1 family membrane protein insertase
MDRRTIWAILLMMAIAIAPALLIKRPPKPATPPAGQTARADSGTAARPAPPQPDTSAVRLADTTRAETQAADTIRVTSPLYTYGISTVGGRLVEATLTKYRSMAPGDAKAVAQILPPQSRFLAMSALLGADTIPLGDLNFTPSADSLSVTGPSSLRLTASKGQVSVTLTYTFRPDDYQIGVSGQLTGVGPNGGQLLVEMGPTLANTEANEQENHRALALVTKRNETERTDFASLKPGEPRTISGPLDWAAVKSKYFVTAVLAFDSAGGGIGGVTATARKTEEKRPTSADIRLGLPLKPSGAFAYTVYAGPMEYDRLGAVGHDFDDVNPYGWPGFRTVIRPVAGAVRWLLVWMHDHLSLPYGLVLIFFGILVRLLLWPLNQKAMRANLQLQAVQPLMKEIQDKYKSDPQRLQQEMFKLYKEHSVNPLGGCWPMLLPMPVLFALFFVFQNTIELRGASFLWLPDLSRPDPVYVIPLIMGLSMFGLSKVGSMGMPPNPQTKMMLYIMPVMMTFLFLNFASGLNLYYAVSNISSIPQQWLLARERMKRTARQTVEVKTKEPVAGKQKKKV